MPLESNCQQLATEVKITGIEWVDIPAGQACPRTHSGSSATVHCVIRLAGVLSRTAGRPDAGYPFSCASWHRIHRETLGLASSLSRGISALQPSQMP